MVKVSHAGGGSHHNQHPHHGQEHTAPHGMHSVSGAQSSGPHLLSREGPQDMFGIKLEDVPEESPTRGHDDHDFHDHGISLKKNTKKDDPTKMKVLASPILLQQDRGGQRSIFTKLVLNPNFENVALAMICANALWIGFDIDQNGREGSMIPKSFFKGGESMFCGLFFVELLIRILAYRTKKHFFLDPFSRRWNLADLFLVFFMVLDTWVVAYAFPEMDELQLLSILRLARLARLTRILRLVPELGMMVKSMVAAIRSVLSTCLLAFGLMYMFAIIFTQWAKTYGSQGKCIGFENMVCIELYFGSLLSSFLSLIQILVFDDTFEMIRPIFREKFSMGALLIIYILLMSFTLMNILIGIICDIVHETTASEKEKQLRYRVEHIFTEMDTDLSGNVSREEFQDAETLGMLEDLGIEPQICKNGFDILDVDKSGTLERDEFIRMIFKCLNAPKAEDVLEIDTRVEKLADFVGLGRKAIMVLDKERSAYEGAPNEMDVSDQSPFLASVAAVTKKAEEKHMAAKSAIEDKTSAEIQYAERMRGLKRKLGNVLLMADGGALRTKNATEPGGGTSDTLMLENGSKNGATAAAQADTFEARVVPSLPPDGLMSTLKPALRSLDARLHAIRAECKASGMKQAGNIPDKRGKDVLPRHNLQPLDELITEVLQCLETAGKALQLPETKPSTPQRPPRRKPKSPRTKQEVLALAEGRAESSGRRDANR